MADFLANYAVQLRSSIDLTLAEPFPLGGRLVLQQDQSGLPVVRKKISLEALSYGADALILWVLSVDYTNDVMAGPQVLRQMSSIYRMVGGMLRFLLANLHD
ncbi:unnamed protein product [Ilex paraguariensis]|uniref:Uncharacterized protein n=1 Tax=Ilex paraguariensis TaxID=185542 RepID=A0ABC8TCV2_9AQUA